MAVPKKKTSVSRKGMRRAGQHHKLYFHLAQKCPNCQQLTQSHCVCQACGQYKGRQVFTIRDRSKSDENENLSDGISN